MISFSEKTTAPYPFSPYIQSKSRLNLNDTKFKFSTDFRWTYCVECAFQEELVGQGWKGKVER
jgi:hypothetical protein